MEYHLAVPSPTSCIQAVPVAVATQVETNVDLISAAPQGTHPRATSSGTRARPRNATLAKRSTCQCACPRPTVPTEHEGHPSRAQTAMAQLCSNSIAERPLRSTTQQACPSPAHRCNGRAAPRLARARAHPELLQPRPNAPRLRQHHGPVGGASNTRSWLLQLGLAEVFP